MPNSYLVITHDGKECHFKTTIKAFDPEAKVSPKEEKFLVETSKLSIEDIKGFTSVSSVSTAFADKWHLWVDAGIGKVPKPHVFTPQDPSLFTLENFVDVVNDGIKSGKITDSAEIKIVDHVDHVIVGHKTPINVNGLLNHYARIRTSISLASFGNVHAVKVEYFISPRNFILNWGDKKATGFSTPTGARGNAMFYIQSIDMTDPKYVLLTVR